MAAIDDFRDAFERLKKGNSLNIPKGSPVNQATVAAEAGRTRSSLRKGRGYDDLLAEIKSYSNEGGNKRTSSRLERMVENSEETMARLKRENSFLKSQNLSLLLKCHSMEKLLKQEGLSTKNLHSVTSIEETLSDVDPDLDF